MEGLPGGHLESKIPLYLPSNFGNRYFRMKFYLQILVEWQNTILPGLFSICFFHDIIWPHLPSFSESMIEHPLLDFISEYKLSFFSPRWNYCIQYIHKIIQEYYCVLWKIKEKLYFPLRWNSKSIWLLSLVCFLNSTDLSTCFKMVSSSLPIGNLCEANRRNILQLFFLLMPLSLISSWCNSSWHNSSTILNLHVLVKCGWQPVSEVMSGHMLMEREYVNTHVLIIATI